MAAAGHDTSTDAKQYMSLFEMGNWFQAYATYIAVSVELARKDHGSCWGAQSHYVGARSAQAACTHTSTSHSRVPNKATASLHCARSPQGNHNFTVQDLGYNLSDTRGFEFIHQDAVFQLTDAYIKVCFSGCLIVQQTRTRRA